MASLFVEGGGHEPFTRREAGTVAAWSVDRLGRSMADLISFLGELHARGADLYLHQQALDTATPSGRTI